MGVASAGDEYMKARAAHQDAKRLVAERAKTMYHKMNLLIDAMLAERMKAYPRSDGVLISLTKSFKFSCTAANRDNIREWLVDTVGDDSDFVVEVVNKKALKEKLVELDKAGEVLPEFLHVSTRPSVQVRGANNEEDDNKEDDDE